MLKLYKRQLALLLSVLAFLILGYLLVKPGLPDYPAYLSGSPAANGTKGLYVLLKERGEPVKAWRKPWSSLPETQGHSLVVIQPLSLTDKDRENALRWVERGNDLLLFHSSPPEWTPFAYSKLEKVNTEAVPITDLLQPEAPTRTGSIAASVRIQEASGVEPLLRDEEGVVAARSQHGQGTVTLVLMPQWTRNDTVLANAHFELLWPYLPQDRQAVWFDDYHHGVQDKPGLLAIYPAWLLAVIAQAAAAAALWLWLKAVRFGPAYTPRSWTVRRGDETLLAAAGWYDRRGLAREALSHQEAYVRSLLREKWGVRTDATDGQILAAARLHGDKADAEWLAGLLASFRKARESSVYTSKQLEQDSRAADELIRKLEGK